MDENDVKKLWIHCNRCYKQYVHHKETSGSRFFLLACQDIACDKCVEAAPGRSPSDAPIYICPICRCKVRGRQINNAMPYHLKSLFHPEPWLDELRNEAIAGFQRKHMNRFLKYCQEKEKEVQKVDSDMTLALTACQKLYLELEQARQIRRQLENRAQQIKQQIKNNSHIRKYLYLIKWSRYSKESSARRTC
ncbi:RING finger protein vilya [Scaptodrosophila lebanonensis]|uniref:RING finger protein vilya n=1 Tax=Drosophila lebanonensis TaxID=7225 RepID=A0A6J2UEV6_DROLE|nr:RING finger protein vilya [Scaptodrosophila lebanonensis]